MTDKLRFQISLFAGLVATGALISFTLEIPLHLYPLLLTFIFGGLILLMMIYSIPIGGGSVSLMPALLVAAYLILGKALAGWAVLISILGFAWVRCWRSRHRPEAREPQGQALVEVTGLNIAMHVTGILIAGSVFELIHSPPPLYMIDYLTLATLMLTSLTYLSVNYLLAAIYLSMKGRVALDHYVTALPPLFLYEGGPIVFSPLIAIIHNRLGIGYFMLFALAAFVSSLVSHDLAVTSRRLQRRVRELGSLQAVGQALTASLDVEAVVSAIYAQVKQLMPASSFYVSLYNPQLDEVSFPLIVEDGQRIKGQSRRARRGLTEYILETKWPLLISRNVRARTEELGLEIIGREAASWVGVPILAGGEVLGTIAVQSHDTPDVYDAFHLDILQMIAAQAAVAIQNARLYERTDEALARRLQELDSVLRTTREGMLLIDLEWRMLAVNRALADSIGVAQSDVARHPLDALRIDGRPFIHHIRYTAEELRADSARLESGEVEEVQEVVVLEHTGRHVERTLTPVRDRAGAITGWLLVFRDMTEELELESLREDMTEMLVHDLRSPMSLVLASLSMLRESFEANDEEQFNRLVGIARRSSDRILYLIEELMDISQLERGQLPLTREPTTIWKIFREILARYSPVAASNDIGFDVRTDGLLPMLNIDRSLIIRVLSNLVDNALKFTPDGGEIALWARYEDGHNSDPQGAVLVGVSDTGPGIPAEEMSRLFEKFQQVSTVRGRRRGTGLGLPFCKLAVEAHGGQISVESEVGRGSTFIIHLPVVDDVESDPNAARAGVLQ